MKQSFVFSILIVLTIFGCTNDNSNTLSEPVTPTGILTYNNSVKAIIDNNCISCHGTVPTNNAPFSLTTYADVKLNISETIVRISRANGAVGIMPKGGSRLPQASIDAVIKWQADGLLQ
ncbi:c-type cytochrome [Flavobacterium sp.]|uniref:c-type cytochrome n=1 Tax=Flavobacterium sp. TaxID=239 RepID=UPI003750CB78